MSHYSFKQRLQDYILSKTIANRIKHVLPSIINEDQTGFLKGRSISANIRLIDGILRLMEKEKIPGLMLFLDFQKAFDSLEWPFIQKAKFKHYYNFGPFLTKW